MTAPIMMVGESLAVIFQNEYIQPRRHAAESP